MTSASTLKFRTLEKKSIGFQVSHAEFLRAAQLAASQLVDVTGSRWHLDGFKGDALFLRVDFDTMLPGLPPYITAEFDLSVTEGNVIVSVLTRSDSLLRLFAEFTEALSAQLSKGDQ